MNQITQSAVSQSIAAMEHTCGSRLIERSRKQLRLTPEGQVVYHYSRQIIHLRDLLFNALQGLQDVISGSVRVAAVPSIGLYDLPPSVKRFTDHYPAVNVHLDLLRSAEVYEAVFSDAADIGLVTYPGNDRNLRIIPLRQDTLVLICHPQHPLAEAKKIRLRQLKGLKFVSFKPEIPTRRALDSILRRHKVEVEHVMELDDVETLKRAVEIDSGVSIVPQGTVALEVAKQTLAAVQIEDGSFYRPTAAIYKKDMVLSPAMREFLKTLREEAVKK